MALKNQSNLSPSFWKDAMRQSLQDVFVILGNSESDNNYNENTTNAFGLASTDAVFAWNITDDDVKTIMRIPTGLSALWELGKIKPGAFISDGSLYNKNSDPNNWPLYVEDNGGTSYLYLIVGNKLNNDLSNEVLTARHSLANISGTFFTNEDGIKAICIGAIQNDIGNSLKKHITYKPTEEAYKTLTQSNYTNEQNRASGICGVGNEDRHGTCCLYYEKDYYDPITGITHLAGDFYKCIEVECYDCTKFADSLDKKYRFKHWLGDTADAGERCLAAGGKLSATNCGPCDCSIAWDPQTSFYTEIINDKNISANYPEKENARLAAKNRTSGGAVANIQVNLGGYSIESLKFSDDYKHQDLPKFPIIGDGDFNNLAEYEYVVEKDMNGNKYLAGIKALKEGGGYTTAVPDFDLISQHLPNMPMNDLKKMWFVTIVPIKGFNLSMTQMFNFSVMLDINIDTDTIRNMTGVTSFNWFALARGGGPGGSGIFDSLGLKEKGAIRLTKELVVVNTDAAGAAPAPEKGGLTDAAQFPAESVSSNSSDIVQFSSMQTGSQTIANVEISTSRLKDKYNINTTLSSSDGDWLIQSTDTPATSSGGVINMREMIPLHKVRTKITTTNAVPNTDVRLHNVRLQLYLGSETAN